jgi:hypothetical protein
MTSLVEAYSPFSTASRTDLAIGAGKATLSRSISAISTTSCGRVAPVLMLKKY